MTVPEDYRLTKASAGKQKIKALSLLALGSADERFEAAVLLRSAAREEQRALAALAAPPAETRLGAAIERCGCFVDARAPSAAAVAWGDVLVEAEGLSDVAKDRATARLRPRFEALQREHRAAIQRSPTLSRARFQFFLVTDTKRARAELAVLRDRFPGELELWHLTYQIEFFAKRYAAAWEALTKARRLDAANQVLLASEIRLARHALDEGAAAHLDALWAQLRADRGQLDTMVFWSMALSCATVAGTSADAGALHRRALDAIELGLAARTDLLGRKALLRALRMLVVDLAAGRPPRVDALYRLGLGDLVVRAAPADRDDPLRILDAVQSRAVEELRVAG